MAHDLPLSKMCITEMHKSAATVSDRTCICFKHLLFSSALVSLRLSAFSGHREVQGHCVLPNYLLLYLQI